MHHAYVTLNLCACCFFFLETPLPPACLTWITRPYPSGLTLDITAIQKTLLSHRPVFDLLLGLMALQLSSSHLGPLCVVTFGHMTAAPPGHKKMSVESKSASDPVVSDSVTPQTVALQAPLSMGFPRREYWHGLPFLYRMLIFLSPSSLSFFCSCGFELTLVLILYCKQLCSHLPSLLYCFQICFCIL